VTGTRYVWLVCGLGVLIVDTLGALAARHWGFPYATLAPVSYILYFCAGVGGGRLAGTPAGGVAGAVTALVDATLGWGIASLLGATPGPERSLGLLVIALVVLGAVFTGLVLGLLGGVVGKFLHRAVG
jgi:hypothetical protein